MIIGLHLTAWTAAAHADPAGQWPQWRGPDGLGISSDANLPEQWNHNSANIKWKTEIPGRGCSSPVVSGDKVFLTTAYENHTPLMVRRVAVFAACALTALFLLLVLARWVGQFRKRPGDDVDAQPESWGRTVCVIFAAISTLAFFVLLIGLFVFPRRYDASVGKFLAETLGTYDTEHVFYIGKDALAATWLNTGAAALLGLAASLHWLRAHSIWRLLGGLAFTAAAVAFVVFTPLDAWKYEVFLWNRLLFLIPGTLVAIWHIVGYLEIRFEGNSDAPVVGAGKPPFLPPLSNVGISWHHKHLLRFGGLTRLGLFLSLVAISALAFVPINLLLPKLGVCRAIVCVDFATGELLWETVVFTAPPERSHRDSSYATPTPATDGRHVVANFGIGVACVDFEGRVLWKATDPKYLNDTLYGAAASVLLWQGKTIIVQEDEEKTARRSWMAAFDTASGDVVWKVQPNDLGWTYTTGLLYDDGTGTKLFIASFQKILCFDVASGRQLWKYAIPMEQIVASLTRTGSLFCVGGGTWGPQGLHVFEPTGQEPGCPIREFWHVTKETPGCASPVIYNGILFTVTDSGILRAYDAATGTLHWRKRLKGRYLASLVAGDGKVYACNTNGLTTVIVAEPDLQMVAQNQLQGECRASFAIADSRFLVRSSDFLYCIAPDDAPPPTEPGQN
ncbi:MAG: PQQ-binding-like beta-propeller repeat protein [Phycisphaerales bacterium]|nr:MAG: PQQ-binding-like beta-propeller repeat protein [Phycisphaerales bacterium]